MSKVGVKTELMGKDAQRLPGLNARIRTRRLQLGLTGAELAERTDISASYVSLIEGGAKVPDEDVAARLARALGDDPDLYRGWARAARLGLEKLDLVNQLEAIAQTPAYLSLVESGQALPRLDSETARRRQQDEAEALRARLREVASKLTASPASASAKRGVGRGRPASVAPEGEPALVPLLSPGADPVLLDGDAESAVRDHLALDRRLIGAVAGLVFAYTVTEEAMGHLRGVAAPGDIVVLRQGGPATPDRICAVRTDRGIVLSRILLKDHSLLLRPGDGEAEFETVEVPDQPALQAAIAGTHVLLIRR
jgi:transcriptional regulator with XRE-family HTH domain